MSSKTHKSNQNEKFLIFKNVYIAAYRSGLVTIHRSNIFNQKIITMVSKAILKMLGMASIEEYFEFIISVKESGDDSIARNLFNELSPDDSDNGKGQQAKFFNWFVEQMGESETLTEVNNFKNYFL